MSESARIGMFLAPLNAPVPGTAHMFGYSLNGAKARKYDIDGGDRKIRKDGLQIIRPFFPQSGQIAGWWIRQFSGIRHERIHFSQRPHQPTPAKKNFFCGRSLSYAVIEELPYQWRGMN